MKGEVSRGEAKWALMGGRAAEGGPKCEEGTPKRALVWGGGALGPQNVPWCGEEHPRDPKNGS